MNITKKLKDIYTFLMVDIWSIGKGDVSKMRFLFYSILKKLLLAIEFTTTKRITSAAAALTYSTLLAIVPIFAVVFGIARGFGYNKYIEEWFRESFSSQPQVSEIIIGFVNSYLVHTKSGLFLGIGLLFMLFTVMMLISNIERTFNDIWQAKKPRSMFRTITDYTSMLLLMPVVIVITSGISIFFATIFKQIEDTMVIGSLAQFFLQLLPYVLMSGVFIALYLFMPNTKVKLSCALVPGILAGVAMQGLQLFYIHSQIWVSSYNAIYGSFAALPLFMLWIQISWLICLFGAELCYANQNMDDYAFKAKTEDLSHRYKMLLCLVLASRICRNFSEGAKPLSALKLKLATGIPIRIVNDLLYQLVQINILTEIPGGDKDGESLYQPAECITRLSVGTLIDRIEAQGKWSLTIDVKQLSSTAWKKIIAERNTYLNSQREVLLKDL
ncbi:YihY/virulence factor BrkB family protein [Leyella stercorea]|jgi:yihY family protein|uniref:YihY/virulence factor BrkB family protein n=1 Tax=Leyella stercorea TaxID=363265 RepID=UPI00242A6832|nr:YihY/virulence factor BrkB family protein [Leyella stercorea]